MRRTALLGAVVVLFASLVVLATHAHAASATPAFRDADGIHVVSATRRDARLWALQVTAPALGAGHIARVDVLLPTGYASSSRHFPVLYLFHGTSGAPDDWVTAGGVEATTAGKPLIVVMPDAGFDNDGGGWFTNWVDTTTALGPSQWETFHIGELLPWVDHDLRTVATRNGRAIAGLSQGGFGSFTYAARHPDLFVSAAAFSGAPDIATDPVVEAGATGVVYATEVGLDGVEPYAMFGPHATNEINWKGHDPATLVTNLRWTTLALWTADGAPGPYDQPLSEGYPAAAGIEALTHYSTLDFTQHADAAHVPYALHDYGSGTHTFAYWARDLRQYVPALLATFAHPPAPPSSISYESVEHTWSAWGWTVDNDRTADQAWSSLSTASASGFTMTAANGATVTTPAYYRPGSVHTVVIGAARQRVAADPTGRLTVTVPAPPVPLVPNAQTVGIS